MDQKWSIKRSKLSMKKSKILKSSKKSIYFDFFDIFEQFWNKINLFQLISNFSIKSGLVLIDFVARIDFDSKNLDQICWLKSNSIMIKVDWQSGSIKQPKGRLGFCRDNLDRNNKFGSKKSIKSWFDPTFQMPKLGKEVF